MKKVLFVALFSFSVAFARSAYQSKYEAYQGDGFTHEELSELYELLSAEANPQRFWPDFVAAVKNPWLPEAGEHSGERFFAALAWYRDTTQGNGDGSFHHAEWSQVFQNDVHRYLSALTSNEATEGERLQAWKMLQKMKMLERELLARGGPHPYDAKAMRGIDFNSEWNARNTIRGRADFEQRVLRASFERPVLVKFGLTYCIHCLLLEHLGSVPAVAHRYAQRMDVYKLWWNPQDDSWQEFNLLARSNGVQSSPWFILYIDGRQVQAGYAFPDENGEGMEEFLGNLLD